MQGIVLSRKCLRFFKRTFKDGEFNAKYFQQDYKALFSHVYKELNKFQNVEYSSFEVLKDVNEAEKLFEVLEPYVKAVFEYYGKEYSPEFFHGGMDKKTSDEFLKELISKNKYKEKSKETQNKGGSAFKKDKAKKEKNKTTAIKKQDEKTSQKNENDVDTAKKAEDVLIFYDRKSFEAVYFLAEYKFGQISDDNRKDICGYISKFSLKKNKYLNDAVEETLSDEHGSGGKKKYSVLDKSVWFELNQTFHFYIHVFHLYDDVYYPKLYEKQKKEGGLLNFFKKFFGIKDKPIEKDNEFIYEKPQKATSPKKVETELTEFEKALKNSIIEKQTGGSSAVKETNEIEKEKEPIILQKRK